MKSHHSSPKVRSIARIAALTRQLDRCVGSEDYVAVIHALAATRDPVAIRPLASLLDSVGPIAEEAIAALIGFGKAAIPAMRGCIESLDYEMIRHAHRVLAALGDEASRHWLREDDAERIAAFLERRGWLAVIDAPIALDETDDKAIA